ncbi:MAG: response regulator transcription factor [Arcobacteraceae bacterium]|jgi:DNA-binding response OmpR family regulator|nr:response regulator transcription factor [Arcobacteraceae bacterium]
MKILYLEDDINLSNTVCEFLEEEGFEIDPSYDGEEALNKLYHKNYDLLLLDVTVPNMNGFELLQNLRESGIKTPAIFITSLSTIDDLSKGYEIGADDYLKKPFILKELLFRIKALLKREYKMTTDEIELFPNIIFNDSKNIIFVNKEAYEISQKEADLLKLLYKNRSSCVNFEEIFETLWSFSETHSDQSLRTYIKNLRKVIGKDMIVSVKKKGYVFV